MKTLWLALALAVAAVGTVGCMDDGNSEGFDEATDEEVTEDVTLSDSELAMWLAETTDETISAEASDPSTLAGCAYIQWCNEEGPWGTVCIWTACDIITASKECAVDARYVCGGTVPPIDIRR